MILAPEFYNRKTETVARELLGKVLVHEPRKGVRLSGRIVETEAYLGAKDMAAHSFGARMTPRTQTMFMSAGHSYVYLIYGMHFCLNIVTREEGNPQAVLIRAVEPLEGLEEMRVLRPIAKKDVDLTNGPGKLCAAFDIDKSQNALLMNRSPLYVTDEGATKVKRSQIVASPRIGVAYAKEHAEWPLRFSILENPFVSKPQPWRRLKSPR